MEDFGLQAILEKMNSLITPLISGPFWDISNIFQKCLIFSQSLSRQKIQLKVDLVGTYTMHTQMQHRTDERANVCFILIGTQAGKPRPRKKENILLNASTFTAGRATLVDGSVARRRAERGTIS